MCFVGGESACGAHAVRAAGDGHPAAATDRGSAADACCKGKTFFFNLFFRTSFCLLYLFWAGQIKSHCLHFMSPLN